MAVQAGGQMFTRAATRFSRGQSGLTLIELMIVILIIGVLAGIIAINLNGVVANAKINSMKRTLADLQSGVNAFAVKKDGDFPTATGGAGALVANAADRDGKRFVESYVHNLPGTVCTDWGIACASGTWSVSANGKAYFTDGTTYWYLPDSVTTSGTITPP
jgi:prepilin-type N-terminal cleavage/methylation domain-containing protein